MFTVASPSTGGSGGTGVGTGSPCAACKFLRRKCQPDCVFAPYFSPDNPQKFVHVHRVFGASNVTKILNELHPYQREDAANSLAYEADMRLRDPVYGCVGVISILQHRLRQVQQELARTRYELSKYQAAAEVANMGSNDTTGMSDFVGNLTPNCKQNFMNVGNSMLSSIGGSGFMQYDHLASVQMMSRNCDAEAATARVFFNGAGGYDFRYSSPMEGGNNVVSSIGQISNGQFSKPNTTTRGDENHTVVQ